MSSPLSTYRIQVRAEFGFAEVAAIAGYLDRLGVSHAYLSPILAAAPGSAHGYDVVDHTRLSIDAGGRPAFDTMISALQALGLRAVADVVPNHMTVPTPEHLNQPLWSMLAGGPNSPYAHWFDVDWTPGQILMPALGRPVGQAVADGELTVDLGGPEPLLRYYDHEFPLAPGTAALPLPELLESQPYRPAWWKVGDEELNYRRFFDVTSLIAIRVERPEVFDATHALLLELLAEGSLDGLRIDHPDGLADPRGYLRRLAATSGGTWVVVEKILESDETLPADWECAGTTGYDALNKVIGLFVEPSARTPLNRLLAEVSGRLTGIDVADDATTAELDSTDLDALVAGSKAEILAGSLTPELNRLTDLLVAIAADDVDLRDHTRGSLRAALAALLVAMSRYRAYAVPGEPAPAESLAVLDEAAEAAEPGLNEQQTAALLDVRKLASDTSSGDPRRDEFVVRFQQTCGPVMAKGVEDTVFYRWPRLLALNEVGADPHLFGYSPADFHDFAGRLARDWPATLTTLTTHDTKRSEDTRARLLALTEYPQEWAAAVRDWTSQVEAYAWRAADTLEPAVPGEAGYLLWQTLLATWTAAGPPAAERIVAYLVKAGRENKLWSTWTDPNTEFEDAVESLTRGILADPELVSAISHFVTILAESDRAVVLGQKLVQLTMPGVADTYQGCEIVDRSLVDPDNRRPVDYARRADLLSRLDAGTPPAGFAEPDRLDAEKLLVTSRALRLRRERPDIFLTGAYTPVATSTDHAFGFVRSNAEADAVATVVTRFPRALTEQGGWAEHTVALPSGRWTDLLTGREFEAPTGAVPLSRLLIDLPVALLARS